MRVFWYGNAATRTFGRARRHRPYGFVWADYVWAVDFVWQIAGGRLVLFGWITHGCLASFLHYSVRMPLRILFFMLFISVAFIFSMDSDEGIQKNGIFVPSL